MLLNEMLRLLGEGGILSTAEIARRLEVDPALVSAMAEDLAARGYLTSLALDCTTACEGCASSSACHVSDRPGTTARTFALSPKGRQVAGTS